MPRYTGTRRHSVWERFDFDADDDTQALEKLKYGYFIGPAVSVVQGEEYSDHEVEQVKEGD